MIDAIIVSYDPFAFDSRVIVYKDGSQKAMSVYSTLDELSVNLFALSQKYGIDHIKMHAPSDIIKEIQARIFTYSKHITIEEI